MNQDTSIQRRTSTQSEAMSSNKWNVGFRETAPIDQSDLKGSHRHYDLRIVDVGFTCHLSRLRE